MLKAALKAVPVQAHTEFARVYRTIYTDNADTRHRLSTVGQFCAFAVERNPAADGRLEMAGTGLTPGRCLASAGPERSQVAHNVRRGQGWQHPVRFDQQPARKQRKHMS